MSDAGPGARPDPATADADLVPLERRVLRLWRIRLGLAAAVVVVPAAVVVGLGLETWAAAPVALVVLGGPTAAIVAGWTALVWRSWRFRVGEDALEIHHGVITRQASTIPYHRVQHIDIEAGPLERKLRLCSLVLRTASASSDSAVPGIDATQAEALRQRILARAGAGDAT